MTASRAARLWTGAGAGRPRGPPASPALRLLHACPQAISPVIPRPLVAEAAHGAQLFSPSSRLRFDRRDADRGVARRRRAISGRRLDRARLSPRAHARAARSGRRRNRQRAGHRAVHPGRSRPVAPPGGGLRRVRLAVPVRARPDPDPVPILSRAEFDAARRRPAHAQPRVFQANRRAEFHHDERRRPVAGESRERRHRAARRQPHLEDADEHLSRQSRLQDRQYPAGARTCRCRARSIICAAR